MAVGRVRTADAEERRINAGRRTTTTKPTPKPASSVGEFGSDAAWMNIIKPEYSALQGFGVITPEGSINPDYTARQVENFLAAGSAGRNYVNTPKPTTTSAGTGKSSTMDVLRALVSGLGNTSQADINSAYGNMISGAQTSAADRQALIDTYYGGAENRAQQRLNDTLSRLQSLIGGARGELSTQTAEGTQRIDEATQRALSTLGGQANPYAGLQAIAAPVAESPLMNNLQALGQNTQGLSALRDMFVSEAAQQRGSAQDMINMLSAAQQAAQQGRIADVQLARGAAQQDLGAAQRAAAQMLTNQQLQSEQTARSAFDTEIGNLQQAALQARLSGQTELSNALMQLAQAQLQATLSERSNQTTRQDQVLASLLRAAEGGLNVSSLLPLLGGTR